MSPQEILIALVFFSLLIAVHEFGHFLAAKLCRVRVEEFSVGMGPLLVGKKWGETFYCLRAVPLGGYNKMAGMEPETLDDPRGFYRQSAGRRLAILISGSLMNFLLAVLIYAFIFWALGSPSNQPVIGRVLPDWPAQEAGLAAGDRIVAINGRSIDYWQDMVSIIHRSPGMPLELTVERKGRVFRVEIVPRLDPQSQVGMIGVEPSLIRFSPFGALGQGIRQTALVLYLVLVGLGQMFARQVPVDLVGPVGVVQLLGEAARFGTASVLSFAAFISLNLGLFNLFPIPALDGSRLLFLAVEALRGRPVDPRKEGLVHLVGFAVLVGMLLIITYRDLLRIFG
ncbi:MAG: RIP metalloprotease RseP [Clostridia bacterium]|nr:RIP metalloprotease RseP [Clostridia bacterium]